MKKLKSYLAVSLTSALLALAACSDDSGDDLKQVNSPCKADSECQTSKCWDKICVQQNPKGEGGACYGKGECRSMSCPNGTCVAGNKADAAPCRFNEECKSKYCISGLGKCGASPSTDLGPDLGPDIGADGPVPDLPVPDMKRPDMAKDLGKQDGGCTQDTDCNDYKTCTLDKCSAGKCNYTLQSTWCLIDSKCVTLNSPKSGDPCLKCDPTKSTSAWSPNAGNTCDDKALCTYNDACSTAGKCTGTAYTCNDGLVCTTDTCTGLGPGPNGCQATLLGGYCLVGVTCYADKTVSPSNLCHKCDTSYPHAWTPVVGKGCVTTYAGTGGSGSDDGDATSASFNGPSGIAVDSYDNVYIADTGNSAIRLISRKTSGGKLSITVSTLVGDAGPGFADGAAKKTAKMNGPTDVALDKKGFLYVADAANNRIRVYNNGLVTTLAGSGLKGLLDGPDLSAKFDTPTGVAVDQAGTKVWVADSGNSVLRQILVAGGKVTTMGAAGTAAGLKSPTDVETDGTNLYFTDFGLARVYKVTGGTLSIMAGSTSGYLDGGALAAKFSGPSGLVFNASGALLVADAGNSRLRQVASGQVTTFAGSGTAGKRDDIALKAWLNGPYDMVADSTGKIYISDRKNNVIRLYTP